VSLERGPLSLVSTTERLLESKSSGFGLETREYGRRDPPIRKMLVLTSPTGGGRSVDRVRSRTQATEFSLVCLNYTASQPKRPVTLD
jgi:hypothetical protein